MKPATKALLEDAFLQILDNTVFRILVAVVILMAGPSLLALFSDYVREIILRIPTLMQ